MSLWAPESTTEVKRMRIAIKASTRRFVLLHVDEIYFLTCCPGFPPVSRDSMALRRVCVE